MTRWKRIADMDEDALTEAIQTIADELARRDLGDGRLAKMSHLGPDNDDHTTRISLHPLEGDISIMYRGAAADVRDPLRAIRRLHAAHLGFEAIVARATFWLKEMERLGLDPRYPPAWAVWVPPGIETLMTQEERDAFAAWRAGADGRMLWEKRQVEFNGHGGEFAFGSRYYGGVEVSCGQVQIDVDRLPATVREAARGNPPSWLMGEAPHGVPIDTRYRIHSIVNISDTVSQIAFNTPRWERIAPVPGGVDFVLPGPATVGRVPDPTDAGWGHD